MTVVTARCEEEGCALQPRAMGQRVESTVLRTHANDANDELVNNQSEESRGELSSAEES